MRFNVKAQAFDRQSGTPLADARVEEIDTKLNVLFRDVKDIMACKDRYESFWNDLNPGSIEVVFVQQVTPA